MLAHLIGGVLGVSENDLQVDSLLFGIYLQFSFLGIMLYCEEVSTFAAELQRERL